MKNRIIVRYCAILLLLALFMTAFTVTAYAKTGKGGSTLVIARIEPVSDSTSDVPSSPSVPSGDYPSSPVQTGVSIIWFAASIFLLSGSLIILLRNKRT